MKRASHRTPQAASAYRRGIRLVGPDGHIHDYRRRTRGIRATAIFAPAGCDWVQDPQTLWDRANAAERRQDSRTAREYEIALPAELPWPERQRLAEAFAQHLVAQFGVAVDLAIHEPAADGKHDERNHHAHFLTTTRTVTPDGMGEKTRALDLKTTSPALIEALRAEWARLANEALSRHNAALIDHRSHKRRGLEVLPTKHEGPKVTWWRRMRGFFSGRAGENEKIRVGNAPIIERLRAEAQQIAERAEPMKEPPKVPRRVVRDRVKSATVASDPAVQSIDAVTAASDVVANPDPSDQTEAVRRNRLRMRDVLS